MSGDGKLVADDVEETVKGLAETLGGAVMFWGCGDLAEAKERLVVHRSWTERAVALIDIQPQACVEVNGFELDLPAGTTTGLTVKKYAERYAGFPTSWVLYRLGAHEPIADADRVLVGDGDEFTMIADTAVTVVVNGRKIVLPHPYTTGARIKYAAERQASIPRHRDLYRGEEKVESDEVVTVESGEEFTMRGAL